MEATSEPAPPSAEHTETRARRLSTRGARAGLACTSLLSHRETMRAFPLKFSCAPAVERQSIDARVMRVSLQTDRGESLLTSSRRRQTRGRPSARGKNSRDGSRQRAGEAKKGRCTMARAFKARFPRGRAEVNLARCMFARHLSSSLPRHFFSSLWGESARGPVFAPSRGA